jgi:glycosyltransferase involved in cell wall biosynthesis
VEVRAAPVKSVAVLLSSREQFSAYYGGALARWTYEVYRRLQGEVDVQVFGFPTAAEDLYPPLKYRTSSIHHVCKVMSEVPFVRRYEEEVWLRALLRHLRQFDVVHVHNRAQWIPLLRRLGYRGKLVLHLQNDHLGHWPAANLDGLAPQVDGLAVCSTYLAQTFAPKSTQLAAKTKVIYNGVDTDVFFPREELRQPKTIFFVGRFDPEKGVLQLVRAFERVLETHPDATLRIAGTTGFGTHQETSYVRAVREAADTLTRTKGADIRFLGYIHHDQQLPELFQKAAIFACPSIFQEPFGLVNAEAMACATPVVGSRRGGIPEVLGSAGRLVDPEDIEALAAAITNLLADPGERKAVGSAALERSRHTFDWRVIARSWAKFLEQVGASKS